MDLDLIYQWGVRAELGVALIAFPLLFLFTVPYGGRHTSTRWGPTLPASLAWFVMEIPAPAFCLLAYSRGDHAGEPVSLLLLTAFTAHYAHRAIWYPLKLRGNGRRTPALSASVALGMNVVNGTINGLALGHLGGYDVAWLADPRFLLGALAFVSGSAINLRSDAILRGLRRPGDTSYRIPEGGLYRWISSPNYFGEIVQWAGWALATWSGAGVAFLALTVANLTPRARANHAWYRETFPDYPAERSALLPGIW
jgi:3-oxo-5-alpha-steroid 4-dehydrogenase 1